MMVSCWVTVLIGPSQDQLGSIVGTTTTSCPTGCRDGTTGIGDNYGTRPDTSCVWGDLSAPGSFDAQYARKVYKQHDTSSGGKKHGGKKHGGKKHRGGRGR